MQCQKCGYEPSFKEIQAGSACPACAEKEQKYQQRIQEIARQPQLRPQEVVVVDLSMSFLSMVRFMVKWALASIPALIILIIIGTVVFGLFTGMFAYPSRPPSL